VTRRQTCGSNLDTTWKKRKQKGTLGAGEAVVVAKKKEKPQNKMCLATTKGYVKTGGSGFGTKRKGEVKEADMTHRARERVR